MSENNTASRFPVITQKIRPSEPVQEQKYLPHSFTLTKEQYKQVLTYSAYNSVHGYEPKSASAVVRDAIDFYFANIDEDILSELDLLDT